MRILCAALSGPGHVFPVIAVAQALAARGHDVTLAADSVNVVHARASGLPAIVLPSISQSSEGFRPYDLSRQLAEQVLTSIKPMDLDAILIDGLALGVAMAGEKLGIPWATMYPHALPIPSRDLPPFGTGWVAGRSLLSRRRDDRGRARVHRDLEAAREDCNDARRALGLSPRTDRVFFASESLIMAATFPSLDPQVSDRPLYAHVVGPCLWEPPGVAPRAPDGDGPVVLVAASTAHQGVLAVEGVAAALHAGARVIVTTGKNKTGPQHPRVVEVDFAPHEALIAQADAVVCNAGHGIVARALSAGVPVVALPQHGDQKENASRLERAGAGLWVRNPRRLRHAIERVLNVPRYGLAAKRLAESKPDGPAVAARLIEDWGVSERAAKN